MNRETMERILEKIRQYNRIMLFRHIRMDGDCTGATKGFKEILKLSFPEKEILLVDDQKSDFLAFLGPEDGSVEDSVYESALAIVLDTGTADRVYNQKFKLSIILPLHHSKLLNMSYSSKFFLNIICSQNFFYNSVNVEK